MFLGFKELLLLLRPYIPEGAVGFPIAHQGCGFSFVVGAFDPSCDIDVGAESTHALANQDGGLDWFLLYT